MFMFIGESWNLKSFLSTISDDFKYEFVSPSSLAILELYDEEYIDQNGEKQLRASL